MGEDLLFTRPFCEIHMIIMDFHMTIRQIHMNIMQIQNIYVLWSNLQPHAGSNNLLHLFSAEYHKDPTYS